jgi:glycosyltransferase involved in cell wall biosynthesis
MEQIAERELVAVKKSEKIRFLTVTSTLTRGGTERVAVNCALAYHHAGFPSAMLAFNGAGPRASALEKEGIPIFVGGPTPEDMRRASKEAKTWAPDILHMHRGGQTDERCGLVLGTLIDPRLRVFEQNVFGYVDRSLDRLMIDLHLQLSRWCLWKWTQASSGLSPKSPSVVVPNSVDSSGFRPAAPEERIDARRRLGIPEEAFVFGRVAQAAPGKWSPELIQAFTHVAEKNAHAWLAVCGFPEAMKPLVHALPDPVRSRVVLLPLVDNELDLQRYYHLMDVFVHVSDKGESFGMVLCEAMLSGLLVITKSTPLRDNSQIEVVPNGKAGIVVTDLRQLTDAMLRALSKDPSLEPMRINGPRWVRENYDSAVVNRQLVKLAYMALESASHKELAARLAADPDCVSSASGSTYRHLLKSAGIRQGIVDSVLTGMINTPLSRRAIDFTRSLQRLHTRKPARA